MLSGVCIVLFLFLHVIEDLVISDNKVWGRMTARGTSDGQFGPMRRLVKHLK
jgi:hypothetical protein